MSLEKIRSLSKDIKRSLEDIQTKMNSMTPQQCYDDLIPIIEDLEILEHACSGSNGPAENPNQLHLPFPPPTGGPQGNMTMNFIMDEMMKGANGPSELDQDVDPNMAVNDLHDTLIRMEERIKVGEIMSGMNASPETMVNQVHIRNYLMQLRMISDYLTEVIANIEEIDEDEMEG